MGTKIISSQKYIDDAIVTQKRDAKDYVVLITPDFDFLGEKVCAIIDGHHSYHAAIADGVEPKYVIADTRVSDNIELINNGKIDDFLTQCWIDAEWYDINTGMSIV